MRVLVAIASKHGSTWEIGRAIGNALNAQGVRADMRRIEQIRSPEVLGRYDGFVIGSAVYAGRWLRPAVAFIEDHLLELSQALVWLFSSGPIGLPLKPHPASAVDVRDITKRLRVREHRILAGELDKRHLSLPERIVTFAVHAPQGDFRNWPEIRAWAKGIADSLKRLHTPQEFHHHRGTGYSLRYKGAER